nr:TetR/AcrR family transcriptional regulator [uncultured Brevundimonas sp.]
MQQEAKVKTAPDGRHLRSERSRAVIAMGMLELVRETGSMPTTDAVADRAGVSRRSVFRHYADVSELLTAAYELQREEAFRRFPRRDPSAWSEEQRIDAFVERASELYEYVAPVRRAAICMASEYPVLFDLMRGDDATQRAIVESLFADYFSKHSDDAAGLYVSSLVAATSWANWEGLRREQGLPLEVSREVVRTLMRGVLKVAREALA